ncbi:SDR family oxidoreductase [Kitasatospora herbaricolor]|uniref:SDR family oxidoreductase n=1 Tax=Kitasatospora herbaricolor TaxID=68217 RepID=UPI0036D90FB0
MVGDAGHRRKDPAGRPGRGQAEDVAAAIAFLTSPAGSFISAQSLHIDGGWMPPLTATDHHQGEHP